MRQVIAAFTLIVVAASAYAGPPVPATPAAVEQVVYARSFELDQGFRHEWRSERPVGEQLLMQFYRAVTSLVAKTCDLEDAYRALSIVEQAFKSHRKGRRLKL